MAEHPVWHAPAPTDAEKAGLRVLNTLTGKKDLFVPRDPLGREVTWYICGPTVYDKSHLGHARSFMTFDVIRRVMEEYFGYNVTYVMNITDVDDKIILRARRNHIAAQYASRGLPLKQVLEDGARAFAAVEASRRAAVERALADLRQATDKDKADAETRLSETTMKENNVVEAHRRADEALAAGRARGDAEEALVKAYLAHAIDAVAEHLDSTEGERVTDHAIFREHARRCEREFHEDMEALGVREPTILTRVTEYVPQIVEFVKRIIANGFAYESNGSVYFSTPKFSEDHDYCKLAPQSRSNDALLAEGEGALAAGGGEKRNKADFALWKKSKPGEPSWDSPWGKGRPGWHIECSVMAGDHLGANFDVHAGGEDLKFPHHDNELAQSEAHYGCQQWVNYFMHAGHLHIEGLKMSKSLKNFITIREALEKHTARQIRILFLLSRWDRGLNFSHSAMEEVRDKEKTLSEFFLNVSAAVRAQQPVHVADQQRDALDRGLSEELRAAMADVHRALLDSFDTPSALNRILRLINSTNVYLRETAAAGSHKVHLLRRVTGYVHRILRVFGVVPDREPGLSAGGAGAGDKSLEQTVAPFLDAFAGFRDQVRRAAQAGGSLADVLRVCDEVRDNELPKLGVRLEDKAGGPSLWKLVDPEELRRQRELEQQMADEKKATKIKNQLGVREKQLEVARAAMVPPAELLRDASKYSEWDDKGMPTKDRAGQPLSKSALKDAAKALSKQEAAHQAHLEREKNEPGYVEEMARGVEELKAQLAALRRG